MVVLQDVIIAAVRDLRGVDSPEVVPVLEVVLAPVDPGRTPGNVDNCFKPSTSKIHYSFYLHSVFKIVCLFSLTTRYLFDTFIIIQLLIGKNNNNDDDKNDFGRLKVSRNHLNNNNYYLLNSISRTVSCLPFQISFLSAYLSHWYWSCISAKTDGSLQVWHWISYDSV